MYDRSRSGTSCVRPGQLPNTRDSARDPRISSAWFVTATSLSAIEVVPLEAGGTMRSKVTAAGIVELNKQAGIDDRLVFLRIALPMASSNSSSSCSSFSGRNDLAGAATGRKASVAGVLASAALKFAMCGGHRAACSDRADTDRKGLRRRRVGGVHLGVEFGETLRSAPRAQTFPRCKRTPFEAGEAIEHVLRHEMNLPNRHR